MKKKSSYQKLKEKNAKLRQDIITLVTKPDSLDAITIKMAVGINKQQEEAFWMGSTETIIEHKQQFAGFINKSEQY